MRTAPRHAGVRFTNEPVPAADLERLGLHALVRRYGSEPRDGLRWTVDRAADAWLARLPWRPGETDQGRFLFGWRGQVTALHLEVIVRRRSPADERGPDDPHAGARGIHEWRAPPGAQRIAAPPPLAALEEDYLFDLRAALAACMMDGRHPAAPAHAIEFGF
jgi:hypothetical protein